MTAVWSGVGEVVVLVVVVVVVVVIEQEKEYTAFFQLETLKGCADFMQ